ncbi:hypothetical protein SLS62_009190 [Diatrype stigma]|uniref:Synaptobrevin n=1 Tax=Diatrype stigma TaxID=117547 RepID=A0AAN9UFK9_9PEZI
MARVTQGPIAPRRNASDPDSLSSTTSLLTDLSRLLARLQQTVLHADAERERRLRTSEYERNKAGINLEYARTLLTKLGQDALAVKVHARRQELQADLARKRDVFEQLAERLRELEDLSIDSDDDDNGDDSDDGSSSEGEDLIGGGVVVHTPSGSPDSRPADRGHAPPLPPGGVEEAGRRGGSGGVGEDEAAATEEQERRSTRLGPTATQTQIPSSITTRPAEPQTTETKTVPATTITEQNLRPRGGGGKEPAATLLAPDKGTTARQREQLLGGGTSNSTTATTTATTEAILDHHRAEQDALTDSLVRMAAALKQSSRAFATSLESEKAVLDAAGQGLERSETGLEAAARRMGSLTRMAEGRGWWGRVMLYAWIFGLMVLAVLIVFVLPKLRF